MKKFFVLLMASAIILTSGMVFAGDGQFPEIYNITLTAADTEYSQAITGVKKFTVHCRTNFATRIAFETGKVATPTAPYGTIKSGSVYWEDDVIVNKTIYLATDEAGTIIEIFVWR